MNIIFRVFILRTFYFQKYPTGKRKAKAESLNRQKASLESGGLADPGTGRGASWIENREGESSVQG